MPSQIIHALAARNALQRIGSSYTQMHQAAFNLGSQGPDIFSHNRRTRPFALSYSRLLHRRNYGVFCSHFIKQTKNLTDLEGLLCRSWFFGFVTHPVIDRMLHPYIIYKSFGVSSPSGYSVNPARFHAFFERILDVLVFEQFSKTPVSEFDTGSTFSLAEAEIDILAVHISKALSSTYITQTEEDIHLVQRICNSFIDSIYFYGLTNPSEISLLKSNSILCKNDPFDRFQRFFTYGLDAIALLFPDKPSSLIDYLNTGHSEWKHPVSGETSYSSVIELFELSVLEASEILSTLSSFYSGSSLTSADLQKFENLIGNGCLGIAGPDGKIGQVVFNDPFPLDIELLDQMDQRTEWLAHLIC